MPARKSASKAASPGEPLRKELLTVKDVAAALGVGTERVYQLISAGEIPAIRVGSKQGGVRVPRQAFEEHLHRLNEAARASCRVSEFTEAFQQSGAAVMELLTPTPEQQAYSDQVREGFLMGLRNMALPR